MTQADVANAPVRLGDLFRIKHGFAFKGEFFSDEVGDIVLTPGNFQDRGGLKFRADKDRSYTGIYPAEYRLLADDLLVVMTDLTQEARILGAPAFVPPGVCCLHNQRLGKVVDMDTDRLDRRFLYYILNDYDYREYLRATATGSTVKHTSPGRIGDFQLFLPHLHTQRRIASILSAYDDLIEVNRRRVAILEEMARRLFEEWFVHLRFPGHEAVPVHDTPDGPLPEGWSFQRIGDTFDLLGGGTPSKAENAFWHDGSIAWFTPSDLTNAKSVFMDTSGYRITDEGLRRSSAQLFPPFSVMMTSRATIGAIAINTTPATTNQGFITCRPNNRAPLVFLSHWLKRNVPVFIAYAGGATFKEITKGVFRRLPIAVPPETLTAKFERLARPILDTILAVERSQRRLAAARDLLLPRLVSGELSVIDAPAPERLLEAAD